MEEPRISEESIRRIRLAAKKLVNARGRFVPDLWPELEPIVMRAVRGDAGVEDDA